MMLRCSVLVCAACAMSFASDEASLPEPPGPPITATDLFQQAFERAVPSPFKPPVNQSTVPGQNAVPPHMSLIAPQAARNTSDCAIPLLEAPVPKDKALTMQEPKQSRRQPDTIAKPSAVPACPAGK